MRTSVYQNKNGSQGDSEKPKGSIRDHWINLGNSETRMSKLDWYTTANDISANDICAYIMSVYVNLSATSTSRRNGLAKVLGALYL